MTAREGMTKLKDFTRGIRAVQIAVGALFGALLVGAGGNARYGELMRLPARVQALESVMRDSTAHSSRVQSLEQWRETTADPALRFLVCSQDAINEGRDPRDCRMILQGLDELLQRPRKL